MSLVTTARFNFGKSLLLSRSTSAVLPDPTGPAIPTRNALPRSWLSIARAPEFHHPLSKPELAPNQICGAEDVHQYLRDLRRVKFFRMKTLRAVNRKSGVTASTTKSVNTFRPEYT